MPPVYTAVFPVQWPVLLLFSFLLLALLVSIYKLQGHGTKGQRSRHANVCETCGLYILVGEVVGHVVPVLST